MARYRLRLAWDSSDAPPARGAGCRAHRLPSLMLAGALTARSSNGIGAAAGVAGRSPALSARGPSAAARVRMCDEDSSFTGSQQASCLDLLSTPSGEASASQCCAATSVSVSPKSGDRRRREELREQLPQLFIADDAPLPCLDAPLKPRYSLWVSMQGGNGRRNQQKALAEWEQQQREWQLGRAERQRETRQRQLEADERNRLDREAERQRLQRVREVEEAIQLREQQDAQQRELEAQEALRRAEEAEQLRIRCRPRACGTCGGDGACGACEGRGWTPVAYISAVFTDAAPSTTHPQRGAFQKGCGVCGGFGDDVFLGSFVPGTGRCQRCKGEGLVHAPAGGWLDDEEAEQI